MRAAAPRKKSSATGHTRGVRASAKLRAQERMRAVRAKKALAAAKKKPARVTPPVGVWAHAQKSHRALRREAERIYALSVAQAEADAVAGDVVARAFSTGRASAMLWAISAMDAVEAALRGQKS